MELFTIEKLKRNPNTVLEAVRGGPVEISHRDRPPMILILREHLEHLQERAEKNEG